MSLSLSGRNHPTRRAPCRPRVPLVILVLAATLNLILGVPSVLGGELEDFERDATKPAENDDGNGLDKHRAEGTRPEDIWALMGYYLMIPMTWGGAGSWGRLHADTFSEKAPFTPEPRLPGEALIPFARLDIVRQDAEGDVTATDWRGEIGYAYGAVQVRRTDYLEKGVSGRERLTLTQAHALLRMSFSNHLETDLGLGAATLSGRERHSGFCITAPVLFHPAPYLGVEFRPSWFDLSGNWSSDYDLALLLGWRYVSLKAGYRWTRSDHESLDGPQAGVSFRW